MAVGAQRSSDAGRSNGAASSVHAGKKAQRYGLEARSFGSCGGTMESSGITVATLLLRIGKRELQKCTFNRKEALFTPSDSATRYLSCAVRETILLPGTGVLKSSDIILRMDDRLRCLCFCRPTRLRWRKLRVRFRRSQNYVVIHAVFAMNLGQRVFRRGDHFEKSLPRRVTDQHHKLPVLGVEVAIARTLDVTCPEDRSSDTPAFD